MRRAVYIRLVCALAVLLIILGGGAFYYFRVYTKTPAYALQEAKLAVENHDITTFDRYVDVDALVSNGYDAFINATIDTTPQNQDSKEAAMRIARLLKAPLVASFGAAIDNYVRTGTWTDADAGVQKDAGQTPVGISDLMARTGFRDAQVQGIDGIDTDLDSGTAIAKIAVQGIPNSPFIFEVELVRQDDRTWRVNEIRNFKEYISQLPPARKDGTRPFSNTAAAKGGKA